MKMTMSRLVRIATLVLAGVAAPAQAADTQWEVGASGGTNGVGLEAAYRMNDFLRIRGAYNFSDVSVDVDAEDNNGVQGDELRHSADLDLSNFSILADWFPWGGIFRISAGALFNQNDYRVETTCDNPSGCEVGSGNFSRAEIGTITTDIDIEDIGPYLGVGWSRPFGATRRWTVNFDIGAYYQGSPKVEMSSNGSCANASLPIFNVCSAALENEEDEIEDELEDLKFYPVLSVGIGYRF